MELVKYLFMALGIAVVVVFGSILLKNLGVFLYKYISKTALNFNKKLNGYFDSVINVNFGNNDNADEDKNLDEELDETESGEDKDETDEPVKKTTSKKKSKGLSKVERLVIEKLRDKDVEDYACDIVTSMIENDCVLRDVYLNFNGIIYAIDLIVVYNSGIYAIESRTLEGYVEGDQDTDIWTQTDKNGKKIEFDNPIKYNLNQVNALYGFLKDKMKVNYNWFKEYLLINGYKKMTFKEINKENKSIINPKKFEDIFRKDIVYSEKYLNNKEINDIVTLLKKECMFGDEGKEKYLKQFK